MEKWNKKEDDTENEEKGERQNAHLLPHFDICIPPFSHFSVRVVPYATRSLTRGFHSSKRLTITVSRCV